METIIVNKALESHVREEGYNFKEQASNLLVHVGNSTKQDCFDLGFSIAQSVANFKANQSEEFWLPSEYSVLLQKAIETICEEQRLTNNSITFIGDGGNSTKVVVKPTNIMFLFNVFAKYGKLVSKHDRRKGYEKK